jgi:hypothetical protein
MLLMERRFSQILLSRLGPHVATPGVETELASSADVGALEHDHRRRERAVASAAEQHAPA